MKRSFEHQMLRYLTLTMTMTSLFVMLTMLVSIGGSAMNLLQSNQVAVIRGLQSLYDKTGIPADKLLETYPLINHSASVLPEEVLDQIPEKQLEKLNDGQIVYNSLTSTSLIKIGDEILQISAYPLRTRLLQTVANAALILIGFFAAGMLLATISSRNFSRSIVELSRATRRVADGDFSSEVTVHTNDPIEVQQLTRNFNTMVKDLSKNATLKSDFISSVSHEFKTPLAAIKGYATYASDPSLTDEQRAECLRVVLEEAETLTTMTGNILRLSKLEHQEIPEKKVTFRLDEQLRQCVLALEPGWSEKQLEPDIDLEEINYTGDDELLRQVWMNLLQNAIKFSNDGGTLGVKLFSSNEGIHVSISDTGIGMTEEVRSRIFDKFYQGDKAHHSQGNGLGLALVQQILNMIGAGINVQSAPGKGSVFTVLLPVDKPSPAQQAIPARTVSK